jgi:hypothetical protein
VLEKRAWIRSAEKKRMVEKETMKLMKGMEVNKCRLCILTNQHQSTIGAFSFTLKILSSQKRGGFKGVPFDSS